jgi:hypothetical protein
LIAPALRRARFAYRSLLRGLGIVRVERITFAEDRVPGYREIYPGDVFPASVIELENGRIWGRCGSILTPDGALLDEFSIEMGRAYDHSIEYQWKLPPIERTAKLTTVLSASMGTNYFHWMTDVLPRIHLLQRAGVDLGEIELFVVNPLANAFQLETLKRFGITAEMVRETHPDFHLQPERMIVASAPGIPGNTPKWACDFLRESFQPAVRERSRKIYVSRRRARGRRVRNEEEVMAALSGFERLELEGMTVADQAALFASAVCVVAPHGAGLTNLVFCHPGTRVIELFSPNYPNGCYENLARHSELDYVAMAGTGPRTSGTLVRDDITVDAAALRRAL